jgi:cell pole-organizing protein PopZ
MSSDNDDLIIDLTELMDEEDSAKKEVPVNPAPEVKTHRPETATFDLGRELSKDDKPSENSKEDFDFDRIFRESLESIATPKKSEPVQPEKKEEPEFPFEEKPVEAPAEDIFNQQAEETFEQKAEETFEINTGEYSKSADKEAVIEAARESLTKDIPEMVESIARPVITDLINEIVASVKKDLPGIIEKVIREEIEKLKKID